MKKIALFIATLLLVFTLTSCKDKEDPIVDPVIDTTLYTTFTDELVMDVDYANKEFIADGIGEVTLVSCTDGDTARFSSGSTSFAVRFLAIDTPESTYKFDPWGKSASAFTCDKLTNATTIVLESDQAGPAVTDGNDRYLAWVWYDGRLLNLELIEQAFSSAKGASESRYEETIYAAEIKAQNTKRHIWGEEDPDYDYSLDGVQITIEELVQNQTEYIGKKVVITGVITSTIVGHPYLESNGFGVYLYLGYVYTTKAEVGNEVTLSGVTPTYYPDAETGALQLSGFDRKNITVISTDNISVPTLKVVNDLTINDVGSYIKVEGIEVVSIYTSTTTGDHTVTCKDNLGNSIDVHIQSGVTRTEVNNTFVVGSLIDVVAPLGRYMGVFQLEIETLDGVNFIE